MLIILQQLFRQDDSRNSFPLEWFRNADIRMTAENGIIDGKKEKLGYRRERHDPHGSLFPFQSSRGSFADAVFFPWRPGAGLCRERDLERADRRGLEDRAADGGRRHRPAQKRQRLSAAQKQKSECLRHRLLRPAPQWRRVRFGHGLRIGQLLRGPEARRHPIQQRTQKGLRRLEVEPLASGDRQRPH